MPLDRRGEKPGEPALRSGLSPPPELCIDGRMLGRSGSGTGVASYAETLVRVMSGGGRSPTILRARDGPPSRLARLALASRFGSVPLSRDATDGSLVGPPELFRAAQVRFTLTGSLTPLTVPGPPGIMHWTYPVPLIMRGWRNLYTIHDAIPLTHPALTPISRGRYRRMLNAIVAAADALLTVSDSAAADLEGLGVPGRLIVALRQGVDALPPPGPLPAGLQPGRYFLVCGTIEPRKNIGRIIDAYLESGSRRALVLAGPAGWRSEPLVRRIRGTERVVHLGYCDRATISALMHGARALLMPSLAEGFGLPVAEAMLAGTPVLASDRGALSEISGGAALNVDPENVAQIGAAIRRLEEDDALADALSAAGAAHAVSFGLDRYRRGLDDIYAALGAGEAGGQIDRTGKHRYAPGQP